MQQKENKKNNLVAFLVVIVMIALIGGVTFYKFYRNKSTSEQAVISKEIEQIQKAKKITAEELKKKLDQNQNLVLLDIRTGVEFEEEHIENAVSAGKMDEEKFRTFLDSLNKTKTVIVIDDGSEVMQGARLAYILETEMDFKNAFYLGGGFPAWTNRSNPTISGGNPYSIVDQAKMKSISAEELKNFLAGEEKNDLMIIDLREKSAFLSGHIPTAINIPLEELETRKKEISSFKDLIVYSDKDFNTFRGAVKLYDLGFVGVSTLSNNFSEWQSKNFEVVK